MTSKYAILVAAILGIMSIGYSYKRDAKFIKITKSNRTEPLSPEEQLAKFKLAEGFVIELVASERNGVINPIDLTFDDAGRLWTQTAEMYPLDPLGDQHNGRVRGQLVDPKSKIHKHPEMLRLKQLYQLKKKGTDRILVIDDPTQPVEGQVRRVAEGLTMPQSILPYKNGVFVAHGSEMLYLEDADQDGVFEKPKTILTGFSFIDSHTMSHLLTRSPGGWINFSHGAMNLGQVTAVASGAKQQINYCKTARFSLDGKKLELVTSGLNNIWGYQLRANGQWYGSEANDKGMSVVPMEPKTGYLGIGNDKLRPYQPMMPQLHKFRVGGTGLSGLVFVDDDSGSFPAQWKDLALLANPITNTINTVKIDREDSGHLVASHLENLLECEDDWFRPVNLEFGPDGCLYIADWYNKIVSHNEIPRSDPSRDKTHGRIWRIRHTSQTPSPPPNVLTAKDNALAGHLTGASRWEKRAAWHQIADRQTTALLPEIKSIASNSELTIGSRIHAIWAYESLSQFDLEFTTRLLQDTNHNIVREIIRSLASFDLSASQVAELITLHIESDTPQVRAQALRTLAETGKADHTTIQLLVQASKPLLASAPALGGEYERRFERFLARMAMEQYQPQLKSYLSSKESKKQPASNILWALQSLDEAALIELFPKFWSVEGADDLDSEMFISLAAIINNQAVFDLVSPTFSNPADYSRLLDLLIDNQHRFDTRAFKPLYTPIIKSLINDPKPDQNQLYQSALILKAKELAPTAAQTLTHDRSLTTIRKVLPILMLDPQTNMQVLTDLANDESLPNQARLMALEAFNRANPKAGLPLIAKTLTKMEPQARPAAIDQFSRSTAGAKTLVTLIKQKKLSQTDFNFLAATRIATVLRKDPHARALIKFWNNRKAVADSDIIKKVDTYTAAAEKLTGNPQVGKGLFQSCLACHAIGDQGYSIAPALDGSASRETHALLTAIMRPDVAVEGGYELYRVVRKDGTIAEGYLYSTDSNGVTIAMMGNQRVFIPRADIRTEGSVAGKSFMVAMFNALPEQNMVDLLSYIKTLK